MRPNIFLVHPRFGLEDQVTAAWHYLLNVVPELGQAFLDEVCRSSGLRPSRFVGAIDHPMSDRASRPDLLLQCRDYSLLFEHKLTGPLGALGRQQLQRYLEIATLKGWKLALLSATRTAIDPQVVRSEGFVYPKGAGRPQHFLWDDVLRVVAAPSHPMSREFTEYLEILQDAQFTNAGLRAAARENRSSAPMDDEIVASSNVFLLKLADFSGVEDRLTAEWHYLLSAVPGIGQAFVDKVCALSLLAPSPFVRAIDHPMGDRGNRPDLLVECRDHCVLFEHKIDSPLGPRQLQRYADFAARKGWKLALLAASRHDVPPDVQASSAYVFPKEGGRPLHFLWQDLESVVGASEHHLAEEFREYLEWLGLGKFAWGGRGNPFVDPEAAAALRGLYHSIRPVCEGPDVSCRLSAGSSVIYQIRKPFGLAHPVHLLNVGPLESVAQSVPGLRGPVMGVWVWVRRPLNHRGRVLPVRSGALANSTLPIHVVDHPRDYPLRSDRQVFEERSYYTPLPEVLLESLQESEERLVAFVRAAVGHLREDAPLTQAASL